jgi:hypothetical protein
MGEAKSTSALTLEDLENKPKKAIEIIVPLKNTEIKYGDSCQLFIQGIIKLRNIDGSGMYGKRKHICFTVSSSLQLPFHWRKDGVTVGLPKYMVGGEEDGRYFCNIVNATKEDEVLSKNSLFERFARKIFFFKGSWECILENGDEILSSFCVVNVTIPRHFKAPKFLEDLHIMLGIAFLLFR